MNPSLIASAFVSARTGAQALREYPGPHPADLSTAYVIQDLAIDLWPDEIGGWKVGRIPPAVEGDFGCDRLAGPVFRRSIREALSGACPEMPVFADGFAAVEAEFVAVIARDAPAGKSTWTRAEAANMISEVRAGIEVASSPFPGINDYGPAVTASDFGNNAGLVLGASIAGWQDRDPETMSCETFVDDVQVGTGGAFNLSGGVIRSVQFMLENSTARGRTLRKGDVVATGQTTGIHCVVPGQHVRISFAVAGDVLCRVSTASAKN